MLDRVRRLTRAHATDVGRSAWIRVEGPYSRNSPKPDHRPVVYDDTGDPYALPPGHARRDALRRLHLPIHRSDFAPGEESELLARLAALRAVIAARDAKRAGRGAA